MIFANKKALYRAYAMIFFKGLQMLGKWQDYRGEEFRRRKLQCFKCTVRITVSNVNVKFLNSNMSDRQY